jgi:hypothetical protein
MYDWSTKPSEAWEPKELNINPKQLLEELSDIGEINIYGTEIEFNEVIFDTWLDFIEKWVFSQWDALNLVIRHEYKKSLESDVNMLGIDSALKAFKNS